VPERVTDKLELLELRVVGRLGPVHHAGRQTAERQQRRRRAGSMNDAGTRTIGIDD